MMAIIGNFVAVTGTVGATTLVGEKSDHPSPAYAQCTLKCDAAGAGVWTTPVLPGRVACIARKNVDCATLANFAITDDQGAPFQSAAAIPAIGVADRIGGDVSTVCNGPLTLTLATAIGNALKSLTVRIYLTPA